MVAPRILTLLSVSAILAVGCDDQFRGTMSEPIKDSLLDLAMQEGLTQFIDLAGTGGLSDALTTSRSQLTIFAPNDAAWNSVPSDVKNDKAQINRYLLYLTVGGRRDTSLVMTADALDNALGSAIPISVTGSTIHVHGADDTEATVVKAGLQAFNGVLYVIDSVPTPIDPPSGPGSVIDVANENGFTTFASAAATAGLVDTLTSPDATYTVFAPNEDAFTALGDLPAADVLSNILLYHVVPGAVMTASISAGTELMTAANTTYTVPATSPFGAAVDLPTDNGLLDEVTSVLMPPTIPELIASDTETSSLAALLAAAPGNIKAAVDPDTLMGESAITLFAPIDSAFTSSVAPGAAVLQHHIVPMQVTTSSLTDGLELTTLNGTLTVHVDAQGNVSITDGSGSTVNVVGADIRTLSGVVHKIDGVLTP